MHTPKKHIVEKELWFKLQSLAWTGTHHGGSCMTEDEWWVDKYVQEFKRPYSGIALTAAPYTPHLQ